MHSNLFNAEILFKYLIASDFLVVLFRIGQPVNIRVDVSRLSYSLLVIRASSRRVITHSPIFNTIFLELFGYLTARFQVTNEPSCSEIPVRLSASAVPHRRQTLLIQMRPRKLVYIVAIFVKQGYIQSLALNRCVYFNKVILPSIKTT